ncbi:hypothetical protein G6L37_01245 [Agrobacterium rubi]|nr:hypothetical protein [Agrobacterium rubi]NTF24017.1 hypothetical protein [Agrobacterium rubi]
MIPSAPQKPSDAWRNFTYFQTAISIAVMAAIIFFTPIEPLLKVSLSVTAAWALSNAVSITKLLRDKQEHEDWEKENKPEPARSRNPVLQQQAAV